MYKAIDEVEAIVFGSPIYMFQITSQAKTWLDRTFPMVEELPNKFIPRHPGKKLITVFAQGSLDPKKGAEAIKYVNNIFAVFGWKLEDCIHYCGTDDEVFNELSLRAFKDGENLA